MILSILITVISILALLCGVAASVSDVKGLKIPNILSVFIIGFFGVAYTIDLTFLDQAVFQNWASHLIAAAVIFGFTVILYLVKALGAGDSKLATAFGLWMGLPGLLPFLFYMTLFGGLLGLTAYAIQKTKPFKPQNQDSWVARLQKGENAVPYGTAIAFGALVGFWKAGYLQINGFM